jgi:hypothetical protein
MDESRSLRKDRASSGPGRLPNRRPLRVWGGWGGGSECSICGKPVTAQQAELELEFSGGDGFTYPMTHVVHAECYAELERERRSSLAEPAPLATVRDR